MCLTDTFLSNTVLAFVNKGRMHYVIQKAINAGNQCWGHKTSKSQAL